MAITLDQDTVLRDFPARMMLRQGAAHCRESIVQVDALKFDNATVYPYLLHSTLSVRVDGSMRDEVTQTFVPVAKSVLPLKADKFFEAKNAIVMEWRDYIKTEGVRDVDLKLSDRARADVELSTYRGREERQRAGLRGVFDGDLQRQFEELTQGWEKDDMTDCEMLPSTSSGRSKVLSKRKRTDNK